jgi:hypothetical protein
MINLKKALEKFVIDKTDCLSRSRDTDWDEIKSLVCDKTQDVTVKALSRRSLIYSTFSM